MAPEVDEPAESGDRTAVTRPPFEVVGSDDAGYCADGVCVIPGAVEETLPSSPTS